MISETVKYIQVKVLREEQEGTYFTYRELWQVTLATVISNYVDLPHEGVKQTENGTVHNQVVVRNKK